ncbi:hypothetical protein, partial [Pseudomonas aeruginosa]
PRTFSAIAQSRLPAFGAIDTWSSWLAENVRGILAVEWLGACQGLDFREGLKSSPKLEQARRLLRDKV